MVMLMMTVTVALTEAATAAAAEAAAADEAPACEAAAEADAEAPAVALAEAEAAAPTCHGERTVHLVTSVNANCTGCISAMHLTVHPCGLTEVSRHASAWRVCLCNGSHALHLPGGGGACSSGCAGCSSRGSSTGRGCSDGGRAGGGGGSYAQHGACATCGIDRLASKYIAKYISNSPNVLQASC